MYADGYKRRYYPILAGFMVDYEEQVHITGIKANMEFSIYHVLPKKKELVTWLWEVRTHLSTWTPLVQQYNDPAV